MSAEMDALVAGVTAKLESLESALDAFGKISARYTTDDGVITAEVDGNGALTGLWLEEAITQWQAKQAGEQITTACRRAAVIAAHERALVIARLNEAFR